MLLDYLTTLYQLQVS